MKDKWDQSNPYYAIFSSFFEWLDSQNLSVCELIPGKDTMVWEMTERDLWDEFTKWYDKFGEKE